MRVRRLSEVAPRPCSWLWPGRLALGKLAMLDGDPGLGKSLLALDLCARLSTGRPLPDGSPGPGVCSSLVLNAEDGTEDTVSLRLQALGADLSRVFVMGGREAIAGVLRLPSQARALDEALGESGARLVVLDPVVAFLEGGVATHNDQGVRRALLPLARLAEKHACAVWLVRHLNKQGGARALYRGGGSIGLLAACRSGWLLAADPRQPGRRVLAQVKNNLGPPQPSLAFEVKTCPGVPPVLNWLGETALTADDLLSGSPRSQPERDRACALLAELLRPGPQTARAVWGAAVAQGLSKRTLQRAREKLDVRCQWVQVDGVPRTYWLLPHQELAEIEPQAPESLEAWLKPLRERYPPRTPLEEDDL
jgi:hypothetical protein